MRAHAVRTHPDQPLLSVVIPTYNRADLLRETLRNLTRQTVPASDFEVVVADDGSSDGTEEAVASFADTLRVRYHFQEDRGFRVGAARNAGAHLARAPLLVFLDSGVIPGPDCLRAHLTAHRDAAHDDAGRPGTAVSASGTDGVTRGSATSGTDGVTRGSATAGKSATGGVGGASGAGGESATGGGSGTGQLVLGYAYGYNPPSPMRGVGEALATMPPEQVCQRLRSNPAFLDVRHVAMLECGFDPSTLVTPWNMLFTLNCSMRRDDFWRAGGFDEGFDRWGLEDVEFAYRMHRQGVPFAVCRDAWVIESPHERSDDTNWINLRHNILLFLDRHPEPYVEIGYGLIEQGLYWEWEEESRALREWADRVRDLDVRAELTAALGCLPDPGRVAVLGAGGAVPDGLPPGVVMDFDGELVAKLGGGRHQARHALGLRTPLPDHAVDTVLLTSRMAGPWQRWSEELLAEAHRIGRAVHITGEFGDAHQRLP